VSKSKPKKLKYELISAGDPLYAVLRSILDAHHPHLAEARVALGWRLEWQADRDGRVTLGMCRKASDLDRLLHDYVILLNRELWDDLTPKQQRAVIDHEATHAAVATGKDGKPRVTDDGRTVYRIRKHDLEEFRGIVERYGEYKADIEEFAAAIQRARQAPLFDGEQAPSVAGKIGEAV
jgi:hypothetical protein